MKKNLRFALAFGMLALMVISFSPGSGQDRLPAGCEEGRSSRQGRTIFASQRESVLPLSQFMDQEIAKGNLKLAMTQVEDTGGFVHERYDVFYKGIQVWGAQLLRHNRNGNAYLINGDLHTEINIDVLPAISREQALQMAGTGFDSSAYKPQPSADLMILPGEDRYRLVYKVVHDKFDSQILTFVDAKTGEIVFRCENVKTTSAIGIGTGTLNDSKKMSTEFEDNTYYAIDSMRPATIVTADSRHSTSDTSAYYVTDSDNTWTSDGTVVDGHAYLGWTYDYYYLVHGRKGMDNNNRALVLTVHLGTNYENAYFHPGTKWIYFGDGNPSRNYPFTTALDIVAHEYTHGVTDATSNLIYASESGALNEAFSDIMAVSCEFFHQPEGQGYLKSEWWQGEDIEKTFQPGRSLADPSSVFIWAGYSYRYPDHYSRRFILPADANNDWGGVHLNCTIPSHWYYLLAHGGTNKTSGIAVNGIGLAKAEKIAYKAWVYYMRPSTNFAGARTTTLQAALDLYGAGSTEVQQTALAWTAVGVH